MRNSDNKNQNRSKLIIISGTIILSCVALILVINMYSHNLYQNASLPSDDTICTYGNYFSEGECLVCPQGSYCYDNVRYFCPKGTGSLQASSTLMNCTSCAKGFYSTGEGESCIACPSGMTTVGIGSTSIDDCV